ncbi:class I SAM-dependent methyltransferase [Rhizorhabdus argentea]|uniref:class I SAM-dependent methyltransferase n=1 Tax=Rhizorhabdus argentea TaxID=1387174 RepID=UPI0030EC6034
MEIIDCPLCGDDRNAPWGSENGYRAVKCSACALVFVNPRPSEETLTEATRLGAHKTDGGNLKVTYRPNWRKTKRYHADIRRAFSREIDEARPLKWLDIGAGYGEFVSALGDILPRGSTVKGVEPMEHKTAAAKSMGLDVSTTRLSDINEKFDVISLMNVFSHIPDFRSFLDEVDGLLNPGGTIFLQTGNGGELADRSDYPDLLLLPDHLVFAGVDHIKRFLGEKSLVVNWIAEDPLDTVWWSVKSVIKTILRRKWQVTLPYRSRFRDVRMRASR